MNGSRIHYDGRDYTNNKSFTKNIKSIVYNGI